MNGNWPLLELASYGATGVSVLALSILGIAIYRWTNGRKASEAEREELFKEVLGALRENSRSLSSLSANLGELARATEKQSDSFRNLELRLASRPCMRGE